MGRSVPTIRAVLAPAAAVATLTLAGCSFEASVGGRSVDEADLEQQISDQLEEQVGQAPEEIDCPGDLDAEVDATIECTLNDSGESYPVSVVVTGVDEDTEQVRFDFEVGDLME